MSEELISASDIRGAEETELTIDVAWNIGKAMADWLAEGGPVAVVYLPTQHLLANAIIEGLRLQGRDVIDGGHGDGEALITYIMTNGLAGGVRVGYDDNDKKVTIELYDAEAHLVVDSGLEEIRRRVEAGNFVPADDKGHLLQSA